jgi:hypothetical protein
MGFYSISGVDECFLALDYQADIGPVPTYPWFFAIKNHIGSQMTHAVGDIYYFTSLAKGRSDRKGSLDTLNDVIIGTNTIVDSIHCRERGRSIAPVKGSNVIGHDACMRMLIAICRVLGWYR